jgi:hypothetical protein
MSFPGWRSSAPVVVSGDQLNYHLGDATHRILPQCTLQDGDLARLAGMEVVQEGQCVLSRIKGHVPGHLNSYLWNMYKELKISPALSSHDHYSFHSLFPEISFGQTRKASL